MNPLIRKLKTSVRVLRLRGLLPFTVELIANLLPSKAASAFRGSDHWWVGKLVELNGNRIRMDNCRFTVAGAAISTTVKTRFVFDTYEQPERIAIKKFLDPDLPAVEFGGGVGVVSCLTNKRLRHPENHVVVEANPDLIEVIERNRDRNGCRFAIVNRALAYGAEEIDFYQGGNFLTGSLMAAAGRKVTARAATLQEVLAQYRFEMINLICDVEGEEVQLVRNELRCLQQQVKVFILEVHPSIAGEEAIAAMAATLRGAGFKLINDHPTTWVFQNLTVPRA